MAGCKRTWSTAGRCWRSPFRQSCAGQSAGDPRRAARRAPPLCGGPVPERAALTDSHAQSTGTYASALCSTGFCGCACLLVSVRACQPSINRRWLLCCCAVLSCCAVLICAVLRCAVVQIRQGGALRAAEGTHARPRRHARDHPVSEAPAALSRSPSLSLGRPAHVLRSVCLSLRFFLLYISCSPTLSLFILLVSLSLPPCGCRCLSSARPPPPCGPLTLCPCACSAQRLHRPAGPAGGGQARAAEPDARHLHGSRRRAGTQSVTMKRRACAVCTHVRPGRGGLPPPPACGNEEMCSKKE